MFAYKFIRYYGKFAFFISFFLWNIIYAGSFNITPGNLNSYSSTVGLIYSTEGTMIIDTDGLGGCTTTSFCTMSGSAKLTLGSFNIKQGQSWESITVNVSPGTGTIDIYINSINQVSLKTILAVSTTQTIDLTNSSTGIPELANGAPFYLKIVFNGTSGTPSHQITSITASYTGNALVCFPSPYEIASGSLKLVYEVDSTSTVILEIYDNRGRLVRNILDSVNVTGGQLRYQNYATWDGKDASGRVVNSGVYNAVIRVTPTDATKTSDQYISSFRFFVFR